MMRKILLFISLILSVSSMANHLAGGEITYKYLGNQKYDVTFKIYRDCRGGALYSPKFELMCVSTNKIISLSATLVSIRDVSSVCRTWANKCNPPNATIKSAVPIFEEQLYKDTLDFNAEEKDFKNCCLLKIGMGQCCRISGITTGGAGNDFWVTSSLDICKGQINSSPVFSFSPDFNSCCNQPAILSFNAIDTLDADSLSYSWVEPMESWTGKVAWTGGRSYASPISDYWPTGFDKNKGPNPNVNPPIGTYLDPQKGMLIFTPTDCSEITKLAVAVREWRKDSSGKYIQIGEITRDVNLLVVTCPDNNPPKILGSDNYVFCEGVENILDFATEDKIFYPPPPQKPNPQDTTTLFWNHSLKGGIFKNVSDTARLRTGRLIWTPPKGSVSSNPYYVNFEVKDNACTNTGLSYKTLKITVKPNINVTHKLERLNDYTYIISGNILDTNYKGNPYITWQIFDSSGKLFSDYILQHQAPLYYFVKGSNTNNTSDTVVFRRNGKYILSQSITASGYCTKYFKDTIVVKDIKMNIFLASTGDTLVCNKTKVRFAPIIINGKQPFKYRWRKDGKLTSDTTSYFETISLDKNYNTLNYLVEVEVRDSINQINSTSLFARVAYDPPKFNAGNDTIICYATEAKFRAKPLTKNERIIQWSWLKDGIIIGNSDSVKTKITGNYLVKAQNSYGCFSFDTIVLSSFPNTKLELMNGKYCQNKNELKQNEMILSPNDLNIYTKIKWSVLKSLKDKLGVLNPVDSMIKDLDTLSGYNYKLVFGEDIVDMGSSKRDSLKFILVATDSFKCQSKDTMTIEILKSPEITVVSNQSYCRNIAIDLTKKTTSNLPMKIGAINRSGYDEWPLEGEIVNGIIKQKYFKPEGGNYFIRISATNEMCSAMDSINLTINSNPIAVVDVQLFRDSVKFTDNSKYTTSRNWYLNNVIKTNDKSFIITKAAAYLKSVRLELKNLNCSFDTIFTIKTLVIKNPQNNHIEIYPNPVNQTLTIETNNSKPFQIRVLNALGQIVLTKRMVLPIDTIDVAQLCEGVYNLEIIVDDTISRLRFIKK